MAVTNEYLIFSVFHEMVKYKPSLQKMLIADEDEEEKLDPRLLGDIVIKNFPWPIGIVLRRLFSASMRQPDRMRLDQIFKAIERTMQFISFVLICQIWKAAASNKQPGKPGRMIFYKAIALKSTEREPSPNTREIVMNFIKYLDI